MERNTMRLIRKFSLFHGSLRQNSLLNLVQRNFSCTIYSWQHFNSLIYSLILNTRGHKNKWPMWYFAQIKIRVVYIPVFSFPFTRHFNGACVFASFFFLWIISSYHLKIRYTLVAHLSRHFFGCHCYRHFYQ